MTQNFVTIVQIVLLNTVENCTNVSKFKLIVRCYHLNIAIVKIE